MPNLAILGLALNLPLCFAAESTDHSFADPFSERLRDGWSWIREDTNSWRITPRGLEIRVQPGNMWGAANNARNVLTRPVPDPTHQTVTASVRIQNRPTEQYEQVNLVWYYDDSHMVKIGLELVDGKLSIVMGREEKDACRTVAIIPIKAFAVDVRLVAHGTELRGDYRTTESDTWQTAGSCTLPRSAQSTPKISLQCYQGPAQTERWASLTDFRIQVSTP